MTGAEIYLYLDCDPESKPERIEGGDEGSQSTPVSRFFASIRMTALLFICCQEKASIRVFHGNDRFGLCK